MNTPRLRQQHDSYLQRQVVHFRQGEDSHLVCYRPDVTQCFGPLYRQALPRF